MRLPFLCAVLIATSSLLSQAPAKARLAPPNWRPAPAALEAECAAGLTRVKEVIATSLARPLAERTFDNSFKPIELATNDFVQAISPLTFLISVSPDSAIRAAAVNCSRSVNTFFGEFATNADYYATAVAIEKSNTVTTLADRKLLSLSIEGLRQSGAGLDSVTRKRSVELSDRLSDISRDFHLALNGDTTTITANDGGIAGLGPEFVATLKRNAAGLYVIPVNEATLNLVMRNASNSDTRERYYRAYDMRGGAANVERLRKALFIRDSLAHLLGARNWAALQLQTKTAKTPERVMGFLKDLDATLLPKANAERAERAALKFAGGDKGPYRPWDARYYSAMLRKQKYSLNEEELRDYFPVDHVVPAVLDIYSHLFGVRFREVKPADAWAPDVLEYEVADSATGASLGLIYLDLFPRPHKYSHFAKFTLRYHILRPDGSDRPIGAIVGNWPTPAPGKPSRLTHDDVVTFFHEFGHLMAGTFAESPYGTNLFLRADFGEAPSQMLENWMWQPEVLERVSRHVVTGKPLPRSVIDKMVAAKHVDDGLYNTMQLFYALYDMTLHTSPPDIDPTATWYTLLPRVTGAEGAPGGVPEAGFGHIMGYDANYYGYLWAKVFAQDLFTRFEKEGVFNSKTGMDYRHLILEQGGLKEPDELLQSFLGRPVSYDAFYRDLGIKRP